MQQVILDSDSITRLLTLRYDPTKKPVIKRLTPSDFGPRNFDKIESRVCETIKKDLLEARRTMKFKQISLTLSGGVDSRLTLAMIRSFLPDTKVNCISVGFGDKDDEIEQAKEIARISECKFHGMILDNILIDLPRLISIVREPRWNLYHFYAFEYGKKVSDVFYTGDGGDELFGGYTFRYHKFLSLLPENADWKEKAKLYLSCHERDWVPSQDKVFGPAVRFSWDRIYQIFQPYFDNTLNPLDQVFLADFDGKLLYDWLPGNAAFAKYLKIKIESIFLTSNMIHLATHIPWQKKYNLQKNVGKLVLHSILSRYKGSKGINVVKKGFSVNLVSLWNRNGREIATRYVNAKSEVVRNGLVSERWIGAAHKSLQKDSLDLSPRYINKMLAILALEVWYRLFVSRTMGCKQRL